MRLLMKKSRLILLYAVMAALTGCGSYHTEFSCNKTYPAQCVPIHEVNDQIDQDVLDSQLKQRQVPLQVGYRKPYAQTPATKQNSISETETVQIWLAGYYDPQGYYHHAHTIDVSSLPKIEQEVNNAQ